jgi:hypothetical protein
MFSFEEASLGAQLIYERGIEAAKSSSYPAISVTSNGSDIRGSARYFSRYLA